MIRAASLSLGLNLANLSHFLQASGVPHRIAEESGQQVIWVDGEAEADLVQRVLQQWNFAQEPVLVSTALPPHIGRKFANAALRAFIESPVSLCLILLCILVAVISELGARPDRVVQLFYPRVASDSLLALLAGLASLGNLLRSLTPMFLHFGELHLIFNMLWLWYLGRQLEPIHRWWVFLLLVLITDFAGNTTQYLYSQMNNFGGMSGVIYGLIGYTWIVHIGMPHSRLQLNNSTFVVFVVALVLMEVLASSWIASAAHVGGLVMGLLLGVGMVVYYRWIRRQDHLGNLG